MINAQVNPLLGEFKTPHQTAPFSVIKNDHFLPAFKEAIELGEKEIQAITDNANLKATAMRLFIIKMEGHNESDKD